MVLMAEERTLYVLVEYTDRTGARHQRGESVTFARDDREGSELLQRGILSVKPVRRAAGESSGRSRKGEKE